MFLPRTDSNLFSRDSCVGVCPLAVLPSHSIGFNIGIGLVAIEGM